MPKIAWRIVCDTLFISLVERNLSKTNAELENQRCHRKQLRTIKSVL